MDSWHSWSFVADRDIGGTKMDIDSGRHAYVAWRQKEDNLKRHPSGRIEEIVDA
jgi:hypothetical protein